jgi:hypothetical protein
MVAELAAGKTRLSAVSVVDGKSLHAEITEILCALRVSACEARRTPRQGRGDREEQPPRTYFAEKTPCLTVAWYERAPGSSRVQADAESPEGQ